MMTSEKLAATLDAVVLTHWGDAVDRVQALPLTEQLDELNRVRGALMDWRERARLQGIEFIRNRGGQVPDDFGLPSHALVLSPAVGHA